MALGDLYTLVDNNAAMPATATTRTYKMCSGSSLVDVSISLVLTDNDLVSTVEDGCNVYRTNIKYKFTSNKPLTSDIQITQENWYQGDNCYTNEDWFLLVGGTSQVNFYSGTSETAEITFNSFIHEEDSCDGNGNCAFSNKNDIVLAAQAVLPTCDEQAGCDLDITGTTIVSPTFQGGSNGSISIGISGGTASFTYSLNGGTPQASSVFSGLTAGGYSIYVEDSLGCYATTSVTVPDGEFRTGDFTVIEPNLYVASENPIITTLSTKINGTGTNAVSRFTFNAGIENNYSVVFNLTAPISYSASFIAKDFPNRESFFTTTILRDRNGVAVGVNTVDEVADSFAEAILKDINLNRWYFVSVTDNVVTLTAKEARASMTLTSSNVDILNQTGGTATTGVTLTTVTNGVDAYQGSLVSDYSLYTDVYVGDGELEYGETLSGGSYNNYTSLELPFDIRNNIHQFDVSEIMKTFVFTPKIDLNFTGFTYITSMLRPFYVRYGEKYPLIANTNTKKKRSKGEIGYKWVLNSSLDWNEANDMAEYFTGGSFLTNSPNPLQIQRQQTNFLYFILPRKGGLYYIHFLTN